MLTKDDIDKIYLKFDITMTSEVGDIVGIQKEDFLFLLNADDEDTDLFWSRHHKIPIDLYRGYKRSLENACSCLGKFKNGNPCTHDARHIGKRKVESFNDLYCTKHAPSYREEEGYNEF